MQQAQLVYHHTYFCNTPPARVEVVFEKSRTVLQQHVTPPRSSGFSQPRPKDLIEPDRTTNAFDDGERSPRFFGNPRAGWRAPRRLSA